MTFRVADEFEVQQSRLRGERARDMAPDGCKAGRLWGKTRAFATTVPR
jgi:hypothetical protein